MIRATSELARYHTRFSDGTYLGVSGTTAGKGGGNAGFRPHELVETALSGQLTEEERSKLLLAASTCHVRRTLSKAIRFECIPGPQML